ncbi:CNNM domain-containing protein [Microbacterium sp. CCNWLW134]|uniref:CNNM domain-containing protein n=1 Tax=Microbacterium sp. CCNWLW134 TaxID=3122064 RepID=UPI003010466A
MNGWTVALITTLLIIASAFFVIVEFALLAARRHRLEQEADRSASARAALRGMNELTVMLAFAQLGITACTFLLGAITKPAIDYALAPVLEAWGLPAVLSGVIAFMLALILVTFLHLVVGEMAPKSWAIAHPEVAAKATGILARALTWPLRPFLLWINHIANRLVRASGVEPVEKAAVGGQDADTIRELVAHSREAGTLERQYSEPIAQAIAMSTRTVGEIVRVDRAPTSVPADATVADLQRVAAESGHLRILVGSTTDCAVAHVRDTLKLIPTTPVAAIARKPLVVEPAASAYDTLLRMRRGRVQLAIVVDGQRLLGVVTIDDLLGQLLPGPDAAAQPIAGGAGVGGPT